MRNLDSVHITADPRDRAAEAARIIAHAAQTADAARSDRNLALLTLYREHGWLWDSCCAAAGIAQTQFVRIQREAPAQLVPPGGELMSEDAAAAEVRRQAARIAEQDGIIARARDIRDQAIEDLAGDGVSRPEIARLTGLTPTRLSQILAARRAAGRRKEPA